MIDRFANITNEEKQEHFNQLIGYREYLKRSPQLTNLFLEVTLACNEHCLHCGSNAGCSMEEDLSDGMLVRVLAELKGQIESEGKKLPFLSVTGGEPLVRPHLPELMAQIKSLGYSWGMTSNGVLITPEMARRLVDAGMYSIGLSIDGLEDSHNWFRQSPNGFQKAVEGYRNLKDAGQKNIMITTVVNRRNISELEFLYHFMKQLDCRSWRVINVEPIGRALDNPDLLLTSEEYRTMIQFIASHQNDPDMSIIYSCNHYLGLDYERKVRPWYFNCQAGTCVASIQHNGDISACLDIERRPELVFGNVKTHNLYDVWKHKFSIFRADKAACSDTCSTCKHRDNCGGGGWHTWDFDKNEPKICMLKELGER